MRSRATSVPMAMAMLSGRGRFSFSAASGSGEGATAGGIADFAEVAGPGGTADLGAGGGGPLSTAGGGVVLLAGGGGGVTLLAGGGGGGGVRVGSVLPRRSLEGCGWSSLGKLMEDWTKLVKEMRLRGAETGFSPATLATLV